MDYKRRRDNMLRRTQSFPARAPITRSMKTIMFDEKMYSLVFKNEFLETKRVNKQMCFLVNTSEGKEWWSIDEFVKYGLFTDDIVCEWVNVKNEKANKLPNTKRRCFMCNRFAIKGKTLCGSCAYYKGPYNYIYA